MSAYDYNDVNTVRLERQVTRVDMKEVLFRGDGPFSGIIIKHRSTSQLQVS